MKKPTIRGKWIAPRRGGYRPGGDFAPPAMQPKQIVSPPPGNGGIARPRKQ